MRKLVAELTVAAMTLSMVAGPALANDTDTGFVNTGDGNTVNSSTNTTTVTTVTNTNTLNVGQTTNQSSNTGGNVVSRNIGPGLIGADTGDASNSSTQTVMGNVNVTSVDNLSGANHTTTEGVNTGDGNTYNSSTNTTEVVGVSNNNSARVYQRTNQSSDSGHNYVSRNAGGPAMASTGNASNSQTQSVDANYNVTEVGSGLGAGSSTGTSFTNTGDGNTVNSSTNTTTVIGVSNTNRLGVYQGVYQWANTGGNFVSRNVGGGVADTGDASNGSHQSVQGNMNATSIAGGVLPLGLGGGNANGVDFINAGDGNTLNGSTNTTTVTGVGNSNGTYAYQSGWFSASSGYNFVKRNVGGGWSSTGNASSGSTASINTNYNYTSIGGGLLGGWTWLWLLSGWL